MSIFTKFKTHMSFWLLFHITFSACFGVRQVNNDFQMYWDSSQEQLANAATERLGDEDDSSEINPTLLAALVAAILADC